MIEVRIGQRGEFVIPKRIRQRYDITPDSILVLHEGLHGIELKPRTIEAQLEETETRWRKYATHNVSTWDLSGEPYEDENEN